MNGRMVINALKGAGISVGISFLLLLLGTVLLLQAPDPDGLIFLSSLILQLVGGFLSGWLASRFHRENGLIVGAIAGAFYCGMLLLGSLFAKGEASFLPSFLLLLGVAVAAAVGGLLGIPGEKSSHQRRKAMMKKLG